MSPPGTPLLGQRFSYRADLIRNLSEKALSARRRVEKKVEEGIYTFEDRPCFCGEKDGLLLATRDYYGFYYPLMACQRCGVLRTNPRMTEASYAQFYDQEYRIAYGEDDERLGEYFETNLDQGNRVRQYVMQHLPSDSKPGVVFETGCNMGAMLVPWRKAGWEVYGTDYNGQRIAEGTRRTGIKSFYVGGMDCLTDTGRKADLMILHHVFEHFLDLDQALRQIRSLMNSGAYLYIALPGTFWWVPNRCGGDILGLLQNAHTYQFSLSTLRYVLECGGFEWIDGNEEVVSLFQVRERYRKRDEVPVGEFERVVRYLRRTERAYTAKRYLKAVAGALGVKETLRSLVARPR